MSPSSVFRAVIAALILLGGCSAPGPPQRGASDGADEESPEVTDGGSAGTPIRPSGPVSAKDAAAAPDLPADTAPAPTTVDSAPRVPADAASPSDGAGPHPDVSESVFDDATLQSYRFTVADADWKKLQATALDEEYVPATLKVGDEEVGRVGLRYKGAHGTFRLCFDGGRLTCRKLSFKVRFDEYEPAQLYRGLKRLNFHSLVNDRSQLHERLAYKLFRQMGVAAPRSVHAKLYVNGEYKGLFAVTENVDGRFTDNRFPRNGDGNLYKEAWPSKDAWPATTDLEYYEKRRKTNEGASHEVIQAFQRALAAASEAELPAIVGKYVDVETMLKAIAVNQSITNWDGPTTFYCSQFGCRNHNFYLYQEEKAPRFWLIPWDTDVTFGLSPPTQSVPAWNASPSGCAPLPTSGFGAPACDRLLRGLALTGRARYVAALRQFLAGPFDVPKMHADIDRWAAQISEAVRTDPNGPGFEAWKGAVTTFKANVVQLRKRAEEAAR